MKLIQMDYHTENGTSSRNGRQKLMDDGQDSYMDEVESGNNSEDEAQSNKMGENQVPPGNTS